MRTTIFALSLLLLASASCQRAKDKTKEVINETGQAAGKAAGEFAEGVATGTTATFDFKLDLAQALKDKGLTTGKYMVSSSGTGTDNNVSVYIIFNQNFNDSITAKAFDKSGLEMGRAGQRVNGKKGEAFYVDFIFDDRTNIDAKSSVTIQ